MGNAVISLFSGAGGIDLGLEAAGFSTRICVELDRDATATLRANRDWRIVESDICSVSSHRLLAIAGLRKKGVSLLAGGPPCQPYSKAGFWHSGATRRMRDPRAVTLKQYIRVLEECLPQAFLLENVPGFAFQPDCLAYFRRELRRINREQKANYSLNLAVLNAADFGVPQKRERLFIVGSIDGRKFNFPTPTHSNKDTALKPLRTAWDAIGDLEKIYRDDDELAPSGRWAALLPSIPEGENYLWLTERGGGKALFRWRSRYWNFLLKLSRKEPAWTIQAQPGPATGPFHWMNRRLSEHELRRLQTFPDKYHIVGSLRSAQKQLGNAVPAALTEVLGLEIRKQLFGDGIRRRPQLVPEQRQFPRQLLPVRPVPSIYL